MNLPAFIDIVDSDAASPKPGNEQGTVAGELRDVGLAVHVLHAPGPLRREVLPGGVGAVGRAEPAAAGPRAAGLPGRQHVEGRDAPPPPARARARLRPNPGEVGHLLLDGERVELAGCLLGGSPPPPPQPRQRGHCCLAGVQNLPERAQEPVFRTGLVELALAAA